MRDERTCLSYWFPKIQAAGIAVPRTEIIQTNCNLIDLLDDLPPPKGYYALIEKLRITMDCLGYPCFLRTGLTSNKHDWEETCYVADPENLHQHVYKLVEFSAIADLMGLPTNVWVVRELLITQPAFYAFNGLPITKERRYFVRDGKVEHHQPYWDPEAIAGHTDHLGWQNLLAKLNDETDLEIQTLTVLSQQVAAAVPGYWSVDWLWTEDRGWVCIDMAEGEHSYRYEVKHG